MKLYEITHESRARNKRKIAGVLASVAIVLVVAACGDGGVNSLDSIEADLADGEEVDIVISTNEDGDLVINVPDSVDSLDDEADTTEDTQENTDFSDESSLFRITGPVITVDESGARLEVENEDSLQIDSFENTEILTVDMEYLSDSTLVSSGGFQFQGRLYNDGSGLNQDVLLLFQLINDFGNRFIVLCTILENQAGEVVMGVTAELEDGDGDGCALPGWTFDFDTRYTLSLGVNPSEGTVFFSMNGDTLTYQSLVPTTPPQGPFQRVEAVSTGGELTAIQVTRIATDTFEDTELSLLAAPR